MDNLEFIETESAHKYYLVLSEMKDLILKWRKKKLFSVAEFDRLLTAIQEVKSSIEKTLKFNKYGIKRMKQILNSKHKNVLSVATSRKRNILHLSDQSGRKIGNTLRERLNPNEYNHELWIKPDAWMYQVIKDANKLVANFTFDDCLIISAGINDISNKKYPSFKALTTVLKLCLHTNIVICSIPIDLNSSYSENAFKFNKYLKELLEKLKTYSEGEVIYYDVNDTVEQDDILMTLHNLFSVNKNLAQIPVLKVHAPKVGVSQKYINCSMPYFSESIKSPFLLYYSNSTGFVETLKPQFTPGQVLTTTPTPITSMEEKIGMLQLQQECENRSQQLRDLSEKLENLKQKRQDDKERLKDYDKLKIQLDQLLEFKSKIMESQAYLQRELQKAKQDAKEAIEARENHADEVADLAEAVEMATLDREMAEEKAETLQLELSACKEKLEEVTLDLEILKNEMQERSGGIQPSGDQMTTYEIKQLQQQNARLRETLVCMRDLSAHDKHEYQKLLKDIDQKKSEITELGKTKEKLSATVEAMEQQIGDLQEQVDAALGAEEMVVILGEQKLTLEDRVVQLEEEVSELEALQDMNNQLLEGSTEIEADLREELDVARATTRQAYRDRDAALETIADRESTINKFRDLVQKLREQSLDLQHRLEKETSKPVSALPEIMDFKKMFSENKAHTKAIDLELRRVDIEQLQQHIKYLTSYMPESFMNRGGDHDAVLILLLIPRLVHKTEILLGQIKDKFPTVDKIDRQGILKGHAVEQFAFRCRLAYYIYGFQTILHQYYFALNVCKPDALLKIGGTYPEMAAQEKIIDGFVELVKRDHLDENIPLESLEKCVNYFNTMFPILLGSEIQFNHTQLLADNVKILTSACDGFNNDGLVIRNLIETANIGDIGLLSQHILGVSDQLHQQLKLVKRRLPSDLNIANIGMNKEISENLFQCFQQCGKILKTLQDIVKTAVQTLLSDGSESEKGLTEDKMKDIAINASDKVYEQDDLGPVQSIKNSLSFILTQVTQIAQFLHDNEYEISTANKQLEKPKPPIIVRSDLVKKELEQTKTLTSRLENKESDIKELRKVLKEKHEQLSEMSIRKELAEKKLGNVNKDYELAIEKLKRKLEESQNNFKRKEKEFEETLDHLQTDIDSLENEKGEMKEKFKIISKKNHYDSLSKTYPGPITGTPISGGPTLPAVVRDSPLLMQEIDNLKKLFHQERNERVKLETDHLKKQLDSLKPLPTFKNQHDEVLDKLFKEGADLKQEILMTLAKPTFPAIYKLTPGNGGNGWRKHFAQEQDKLLDLKRRSEHFQDRVGAEIVKRKYGGKVYTDFTIFPTKELTQALNESKPVNVGFVKIGKNFLSSKEETGMVNLDVDFANLQKILQTLAI